MVDVVLGDILVSGIPCVDFSPMGLRQGLVGPAGALICCWTRIVLEYQPSVLLIDEVPGFVKHGLPFVSSPGMLGGTHIIEHVLLDPRMRGVPASRPRAYCVACRRDRWRLTHPLAELAKLLPSVTRASGLGLEFF